MSELTALIPFLIACGLFFIFLFLGVKTLLTSKDALVERYEQLYLTFISHAHEDNVEVSTQRIVLVARCFAGICLLISAMGALLMAKLFF